MSKKQSVLILGAGMAGLVGALELRDAGWDVTVLEAQERPGGRILTQRAPFADGLHVDLGASRIPAAHELTRSWIRRFDLPISPSSLTLCHHQILHLPRLFYCPPLPTVQHIFVFESVQTLHARRLSCPPYLSRPFPQDSLFACLRW